MEQSKGISSLFLFFNDNTAFKIFTNWGGVSGDGQGHGRHSEGMNLSQTRTEPEAPRTGLRKGPIQRNPLAPERKGRRGMEPGSDRSTNWSSENLRKFLTWQVHVSVWHRRESVRVSENGVVQEEIMAITMKSQNSPCGQCRYLLRLWERVWHFPCGSVKEFISWLKNIYISVCMFIESWVTS